MSGDVIARYLRRHAHAPAAASDWGFGQAQFDCAVVIPAFDESAAFIERFAATDFGVRALLIVVVNAPGSADADAVARTRALLHSARAAIARSWDTPNGFAGEFAGAQRALWVIDRVSPGRWPTTDAGVGLARKIGMDQALAWIAGGRLAAPLIFTSDADARLPPVYFAPRTQTGDAALTFEFRHSDDAELATAQRVYDLRLRYYPWQLARCGSPYAYLALGSVLAVDALAYAQVRGVPRRAAGEDFHLLNKLAKVGTVRAVPEVTVTLATRLSARVPFGTGPGVRRLLASHAPGGVAFLPAPQNFARLAVYLRLLTAWAGHGPVPADVRACAAELAAGLPSDRSAWPDAFAPAATLDAVRRAHAATTAPVARVAHIHTWFDGLRTLRALHRLRDAVCPDVSADELAAAYPQMHDAAWLPRSGVCGVGRMTAS